VTTDCKEKLSGPDLLGEGVFIKRKFGSATRKRKARGSEGLGTTRKGRSLLGGRRKNVGHG